jgi:ferredoxin-NADP reductase
MSYTVKILSTEMLNKNVKRFTTDKPPELKYKPGQAVLVELPELKGNKHPFTFTRLPDDPQVEFTIKLYDEREGVTSHLRDYQTGFSFNFGEPWGAIEFKGAGLFLAGGAGVTPFIAILRMLHRDGKIAGNALWFSNKTDEDVFLEDELRELLGDHLKLLVSEKPSERYEHARMDKEYLKRQVNNLDQYFYICGPDKMVTELSEDLREMGVADDKIVTEDLD